MANQPQDKLEVKIFNADPLRPDWQSTSVVTFSNFLNILSETPTQTVNIRGGTRDIVSVVLEKDFFIESDGATIVVESDRANRYATLLQRGSRAQIFMNDRIQFDGFVFNLDLQESKSPAKDVLTIECKDLLEFMGQGSIPPNMYGFNGNTLTNYHFPPGATLLQCLQTICIIFNISLQDQITGLDNIKVTVNDNGGTAVDVTGKNKINVNALDLATGFAAGLRVKGKQTGPNTKSWNKALDRLNTPHKGESYLSMMKRLCKLSGGYLKMLPGSSNTIVIQAPTYDRTNGTPFNVYHYLSAPNNAKNNVEDINWKFNLDKQHNVVVIEGNSLSSEDFHLVDKKAVAVNELSGYFLVDKRDLATNNIKPTDAVVLFIRSLTNIGLTDISQIAKPSPPQGTSYVFTTFDKVLYSQRYNLPDIKTSMCMPLYEVSTNAHTLDQLLFEALTKLAEIQDKSIELKFKVTGWSQNGVIWQPNMMVNVTDEKLSPGTPRTVPMWIKKVSYHKDKHSGTYCEIICTLPYTHNYELTDDPVVKTVASTAPVPTAPSKSVSTQKLIVNATVTAINLNLKETTLVFGNGASGDF